MSARCCGRNPSVPPAEPGMKDLIAFRTSFEVIDGGWSVGAGGSFCRGGQVDACPLDVEGLPDLAQPWFHPSKGIRLPHGCPRNPA